MSGPYSSKLFRFRNPLSTAQVRMFNDLPIWTSFPVYRPNIQSITQAWNMGGDQGILRMPLLGDQNRAEISEKTQILKLV